MATVVVALVDFEAVVVNEFCWSSDFSSSYFT